MKYCLRRNPFVFATKPRSSSVGMLVRRLTCHCFNRCLYIILTETDIAFPLSRFPLSNSLPPGRGIPPLYSLLPQGKRLLPLCSLLPTGRDCSSLQPSPAKGEGGAPLQPSPPRGELLLSAPSTRGEVLLSAAFSRRGRDCSLSAAFPAKERIAPLCNLPRQGANYSLCSLPRQERTTLFNLSLSLLWERVWKYSIASTIYINTLTIRINITIQNLITR